ncbi:ABC transporter ATP-binding protein [Paenibacillus solisilvae]|uniref:ABC transporter ATP-binding protein n=1 Tax=Paenibacillus solisilvae TaxID=2486751 RepID=A0ABW0W3V8_9BACL
MKQIWFYIKRLQAFAGKWFYINLLGMIVIGFLEGIGIYLIIPMLSLIGIFNLNMGSVPLISWMLEALNGLPTKLNLPVILAIYTVLLVGQALLQRNQTIMNVKIQQGFIRYLRTDTYQSLLQANWMFFLKKRKTDFNHVLTSELARVSQGTSLTLKLATSLIFTVVQIIFAFWISVELTAVVLLSGLILAVVSRKFIRNAKRLGDRTTELSQSYFIGITDHFNGIKDIKSNRLEQSHLTWFRNLCSQMEQNLNRFTRLQSNTQFFYRTASALLVVMFVYLSFEVLHVQAGQLMLIVIIFSRLWPRFTDIQSSAEQIVSTISAFKSLIELQQDCEEFKEQYSLDIQSNVQPIHMKQGLECRNLYFRYDSKHSSYALQHINVHIPINSMTAIVGKSGAGKSTLIDILMGLVQPEQGEVLVDGAKLEGDKILSLRQSVSYVAQDPFLFNSSIRENLMLVEPGASEEQLWEALKFSASDEFVRNLPMGLDTILGDRGIRISGGERQRIVLARAILRKPSILVLDEATSALDTENEMKIQLTLDRLKHNMTIIVIAHRLSTIRNADQVVVLEKGEIIQKGGYQQLSRESKGTFSQLLSYQAEAKA